MVYVAFVFDVFSRMILGWRAASAMTTPLVLDALEMAIWARRREGVTDLTGLVHHTDGGSPVHLHRLHPTTARGRRGPLRRIGGRRLRQRACGVPDRALQERADLAPRPLARPRPRRARHPELGALVQHRTPARVHRRLDPTPDRGGPLRCQKPAPRSRMTHQNLSPETPGRLTPRSSP